MERIEGKKATDVSLPVALAVISGIIIIAGAGSSLVMLSWSQSLFGVGGMMGGGWEFFMRGIDHA